MKVSYLLLVPVVGAAIWCGSPAAAAAIKDPRVCLGSRASVAEQRRDCARAAAVTAMRGWLAKAKGDTIPYQGPTGCSQPNPLTVLRWSCRFGGTTTNPVGTVTVVFTVKNRVWSQTVTLTGGTWPPA